MVTYVHTIQRNDHVKVSKTSGKLYRAARDCVMCKLTHRRTQTVFFVRDATYLYVVMCSGSSGITVLRKDVLNFGTRALVHIRDRTMKTKIKI